MYFYEIYLRGVKGIFTWHAIEKIAIGARVEVSLRNRKKIGLVVNISEKKPAFKTQSILEVLDEVFIVEKYLEIAREVGEDAFCSFEKVLSLMVPEKFFLKHSPAKRDLFYKIQVGEINLTGEKQKQAVEILKQHKSELSAEVLRKKISSSTIKTLIKKGVLTEKFGKFSLPNYQEKIVRKKNFELTSLQKSVLKSIQKSVKPSLLFGVTGSGKTEIYKALAQEQLEGEGGQTVFLLPEIALTPQLIAEFKNVFGERIAVWHSNLSEGEKIQEFARITSGEAQILIGARSAILVPLKNPKLIILDEEHEWTYKNEFAPRFWTHDIAESIAQKFHSKLLFGSATPRIESFEKCKEGCWSLVEMGKRVFETQLPKIEIIDLVQERKKGNHSPISEKLDVEIRRILKEKKQAVIFLNKRGFSGSTMCKECGHAFECPNCSVNMKVHRKVGSRGRDGMAKFICHFCGHLEKFPEICPKCSTKSFEFRGWGTQKMEEVLKEVYPKVRILRADADTITKRYDFENCIQKFYHHEADILLGTQMIAKGLDFEKVELVGIILADVGLNLPDFRAEERVFQLLTQVSGRAGRRENRGKILIQTYNREEKLFEFVKNHDTKGFVDWQNDIRKKTNMPPFTNLAKITFSDIKKETAFFNAKKFFTLCQKECDLDTQVTFAPAFFPRMYGKYHFHVFVKMNDLGNLRDFLQKRALDISGKIDLKPTSLL